MNLRSFIRWLLLIPFLIYRHSVISSNADGGITIIIKLKAYKEEDTVSIKVANLKYNKDFAFSSTLDDGLVSDYLVAFSFFNGGSVSGNYIDQWGYCHGL